MGNKSSAVSWVPNPREFHGVPGTASGFSKLSLYQEELASHFALNINPTSQQDSVGLRSPW